MAAHSSELAALASHLAGRRAALLQAWQKVVADDPALTSGRALTGAEIADHIPALLSAFERELTRSAAAVRQEPAVATASGAEAHGLHRWQQGYDLHEVTRELGRLNECMCVELDGYAAAHPEVAATAMAEARLRWAQACTVAASESAAQFFGLQHLEAAGHVEELQAALDQLRQVERLRAELWQQAAHDLRGNVAVVTNATAGLAVDSVPPATRQRFLGLLQRNVAALGDLLNDVTTLARLQAGQERRQVGPYDAAQLLRELCQGAAVLAEQRGLFLRFDGPPALAVEGDAVKTRRIAQNLILNAVTYTRQGGIDVAWDEEGSEGKRWRLTLRDTGPGLPAGEPAIGAALQQATMLAHEGGAGTGSARVHAPQRASGEGLGLSIVKRLCDLLDANVEVESQPDRGTTFRILFPRTYD